MVNENRKDILKNVHKALKLIRPAVLVFLLIAAGCSTVLKDVVRSKADPTELYGKAVSLYNDERYEEAEASLKAIMQDHPLSPHAVDAGLMLGDLYYAMERYEEAASYYATFATLHPAHSRASYAVFQKGMSQFKDVLSLDRDQTATRKALFAFEDLINAYPQSVYAAKAMELKSFLRTRLAEREHYIARFYFKNGNYKAALARFRDILKDYPETSLTEEVLYYIGESYARLGEAELARDAFVTLINNFPESQFSRDARVRIKGS